MRRTGWNIAHLRARIAVRLVPSLVERIKTLTNYRRRGVPGGNIRVYVGGVARQGWRTERRRAMLPLAIGLILCPTTGRRTFIRTKGEGLLL
jgi:hypothetical protein